MLERRRIERESSFWWMRLYLVSLHLTSSSPFSSFFGSQLFALRGLILHIVEQIKNSSDFLTLFLLSSLLMLSCFMWVRRQSPLALSLLLSLTALHSGSTVLPSQNNGSLHAFITQTAEYTWFKTLENQPPNPSA